MKNTSYTIKIENPCHESWASMTAVSGGKHCAACAKNVIDFSSLTDAEVIQLINQSKGQLCGRFNARQLNRIMEVQQSQKSGSMVYKLLTSILLLSGAENALAQQVVASGVEAKNVAPPLEVEQSSSVKTNKNILQGKVIDQNSRQGIPNVVITYKGQSIATRSNANGDFMLEIPTEFLADKMAFSFSIVGYETFDLELSKNELQKPKQVILKEDIAGLTAEIVLGMVSADVQTHKVFKFASAVKKSNTAIAESNIFYGKVICEYEELFDIYSPSVVIKGTKIGVQADAKGNFFLPISGEFLSDEMTFVISCLGYKSVEMKVKQCDLHLNQQIFLKAEEFMGEIVCVKAEESLKTKKKEWFKMDSIKLPEKNKN